MHAASTPSTLADALARIATLEKHLAFASDLLSRHANLSLAQELVEAGLEPLALPSSNGNPDFSGVASSHSEQAATTGAGATPTTAATTTQEDETDPSFDALPYLDFGPLILRALEIRKRVHTGSMTDEEGVDEVNGMIEEHGLADEQAATLRAWAGQA